MKILFVGLGSIGTRHLNNLVETAKKIGITPEIDALRYNDRALPPQTESLLNKQYFTVEDLPQYDVAFITNPTNLHFDIIQKLKDKVDCFFIEKPIFDNTEKSIAQAGLEGKKAYIACPMRFCKTFMELKKIVDELEVYSARVLCSSYLPDWRKGVDYRTVYSAKKEMGGGVTIDLIHEWDYLVDLFGFPQESYNFKGQYSNLEISSDDISVYIARFEKLIAEVHLDYIGRGYRRSIELLTKNGNVIADFGAGTITLADGTTKEYNEEVNERYLREMQYFLEYALGGNKESINNPKMAFETLKLTLGEK